MKIVRLDVISDVFYELERVGPGALFRVVETGETLELFRKKHRGGNFWTFWVKRDVRS